MNWITVKEYEDITYKKCNGVARIAFNRPDVRNAFRPKRHQNYTVHSMMRKKILYRGCFAVC
jgi:1,4-dihydroxy-2-naphthoyl-CoA synthase